MPALAAIRLWLVFQTAEAYLETGVGLLQTGRFAEAAVQLTRALEKNPKLAEAHYLIGLIRQERGDRELALASFRAALKLEPQHADAQARLAEVLTYQARAKESGYEEAALACRRALALNPKDADSRFHLAWIEAAMGQHANAVRDYQAALKLQPKFPGARLSLAMSLMETRDDDQALALLQQLTKEEPGNATVHHQLGVVLARKDRCADAVIALSRSLTLQPENPRAYYLQGTCYQKLGKASESKQSLAQYRQQQAIATRKQQARFQAAAAHKHLQAGHLDDAIAAYRASLEQHPDATVAIDLSVALLKKGAPQDVPPLLEPLAQSNPLAAYTLALAHHQRKETQAAYQQLQSALKLKPGFAEAHHLLGVVCLSMGREEEGRRHLDTAANLRPDNPAFQQRPR